MMLVCAAVVPLAFLANTSMSVDLTSEEQLGKSLFEDVNISYNQMQSCRSCHDGAAGFADPAGTPVSLGADGVSKGRRNTPTAAYAGMSPVRYKTSKNEYYGGLFWDSRDHGLTLGDPLMEQAQGSPLNPVKMNTTLDDLVNVLKSSYAEQFAAEYKFTNFADQSEAYRLFAQAIAAYQRSPDVMKFSSLFDQGKLTRDQMKGHGLFQQYCSSCHPMANNTGYGAPFTTFGYVNIGLPENPLVTGDENDLGLGAVVNSGSQNGKFKIPTLRNVADTAPYGHNGYFTSLKDMVNFINSRDSMHLQPDVDQNITKVVGNLGLTDMQVNHLVSFLESLSDQ